MWSSATFKSIKFERFELNATLAVASTEPVKPTKVWLFLFYTSIFTYAKSNAQIILTGLDAYKLGSEDMIRKAKWQN